MTRFLNYFFRGLIVLAPAAVTVYVFWLVLSEVDQWLGFGVPGLGILITVALVTLFGFLASTALEKWVVDIPDLLFGKLPLVRLVYTSTRDLVDAFVGEKRRFDRPVLVETHADGVEKAFGFITSEALEHFDVKDHIAVYMPFSYALTGAVRLYPRDKVHPIAVDSAQLMAFVVSGGVAAIPDRTTPGKPT